MTAKTTWAKRLAWFVALWALGVLATGAVAFGIRIWLRA
ncbi:Protein of unknown function [Rhizobium sp. RU20A]|nr:DUF2474 family protein [Rhizobium sp. RU20A]SIQ51734.1 Protein of unknown function [Rhizobium sp. RU20A]